MLIFVIDVPKRHEWLRNTSFEQLGVKILWPAVASLDE